MKLRYILIVWTISILTLSTAYTQDSTSTGTLIRTDSCFKYKKQALQLYYLNTQKDREIDSLRLDKNRLNQAIDFQNKAYDNLETDFSIMEKAYRKEKNKKWWLLGGSGLTITAAVLLGIFVF